MKKFISIPLLIILIIWTGLTILGHILIQDPIILFILGFGEGFFSTLVLLSWIGSAVTNRHIAAIEKLENDLFENNQ